MAQIIREIRVDVSQPNVFQAIVAKQLDCNSRFLKITLVDFGVKIEVPNTAKVTINGNRPDGKSQSFAGVANNDGTITVPLAQWMLEVAGLLKCDVSVINTTDNKRLTSTDFFVNVQEAANKNTDISENPDGEFRVITPTQEINADSTDDQYPSAKAVFDLDNITATATGSAITIESANAPLQSLKLYGKTEQYGTPTPTSPIELKSVGDSGSFEVGVYNSNLLDIPNTSNYQMAIEVNGNECKVTNVQGVQYNSVKVFLTLPKGDYVIKADSVIGELASGQFLQVIGSNGLLCAFNSVTLEQHFSLAEQDTINVTIFAGNTTAGGTYTVTGLRLCEKSMLDEWEQCNKQTLIMPYTLRSVGDIKDEVDFTRGVRIPRLIAKVLTGEEGANIVGNSSQRANLFGSPVFADILAPINNDTTVQVVSSHFSELKSWNNIASSSDFNSFALHHNGTIGFAYNGTKDEVNAWLKAQYQAGTPVTFICIVKSTQETPLTETELNAYRQLYTNKGTTTILSEADMEVDYYINKPNAQAIGNIHKQINKDYLKLQQAIIETGGN